MTDQGRPSNHAVEWAAQSTIDMHTRKDPVTGQYGRCATCTPQGCTMLDWARVAVRNPGAVPVHPDDAPPVEPVPGRWPPGIAR